MESLLYILLFAGLIFMMMKLGRDFRSMVRERSHLQNTVGSKQGRDVGISWVPPTKDVDPICARTVTTEKARPSVYAGNVYYFCSRECREIFEAAPYLYVDHDVGHDQVNGSDPSHSHG